MKLQLFRGALPRIRCYFEGMSSKPLAFRRRLRAALALFALTALGVAATECTPDARGQHCDNDSECPDAQRGHAYCFESHCVDCMSNEDCGTHHRCAAGQCVEN